MKGRSPCRRQHRRVRAFTARPTADGHAVQRGFCRTCRRPVLRAVLRTHVGPWQTIAERDVIVERRTA